MRFSTFSIALLLAPLAWAQPDEAAPLAIVTDASSALFMDGTSEPDTLAPARPVRPFDRLGTPPDGALTLNFADGLRARWGPSTLAMVSGAYADGRYADRGLALDSGFVAYRFEGEVTGQPLRVGVTGQVAVASLARGTGAVLADAGGLRLVVLEGEGFVLDPTSTDSLAVAEGMVGVASAAGLQLRRSTLAERDLIAEPTERRRRLLVPGTDDEGNARTFIIEWDE
jgi:hypothetical protein